MHRCAHAFVNPASGDGNASSHDASATTAPPNLPPGATLLKGTATDFCSAIYEGGTRISAAHGPITDAAPILNEWVADLRTYAPPDLRDHVSVFTTGLVEVSKNVQLGVIATNEDIKAAMEKVLALPDSSAIDAYAKANCPR